MRSEPPERGSLRRHQVVVCQQRQRRELYGVVRNRCQQRLGGGDSGTILRSQNGMTFAAQTSGVTGELDSIYAADATHAWAVGAGGVILFYNGTNWTPQSSGTTVKLRSVHGTGANNVYAVGDAGTILRFDGSKWGEARLREPAKSWRASLHRAQPASTRWDKAEPRCTPMGQRGTRKTAGEPVPIRSVGTQTNIFSVGGMGTMLEKKN